MRRTPFPRVLLLLTLCLSLGAPAAAAQERPALRAALAACEAGPTAAERFAVFTGSMPALRGTARMSMRFDLMERRDRSSRWRSVDAPKWGRWERSKGPRAAGFIYTKRVERLKQEASYRAVVRFRWIGDGGRIQQAARRVTALCVQPSQRPDLQVEVIGLGPGPDAATSRYVITVLNAGLTPAGAFTLGLVAGTEELAREVAGLAAGERTTVEVVGPRCPAGGTAAVQLDVRGVVRESDERDNRATRPCDA